MNESDEGELKHEITEKNSLVRASIEDPGLFPDGIESIYIVGKTLGQGSFATVKEGQHRKTGCLVAIKIIEKVECDNFEEREVCALGQINHPNCVSLLEVYDSTRKLYLVTELVTGGTVMDRVISMDHFSEKDSANVMVDVLHAVQYLHEKGLVHRDLKLENLMYASDDRQSPGYHTIKLVDFGFALSFRENNLRTRCGTPGNAAPEVLSPDLERDGYGPEVDLWSIGVILYSMLCGFPPFFSDSNPALIRLIRAADYKFHSPYWDDVSFGAKDLVAGLLVANPCRRATAHQCLEHPWVRHAGEASSQKLHSSHRSFILLRKLAIFDNMEPACLEEVSSRLQALKAPAGEYIIRAGEFGDAMYFINAGAVQVLVEGETVNRIGAGGLFGEVALTAAEERSADVVSLGSTGGVRCDSQGSPLGRRRVDPTDLFKLTREDFDAVVERFPALEDRLMQIGLARIRRACSPQCSPLRAARRCSRFRPSPSVTSDEGGGQTQGRARSKSEERDSDDEVVAEERRQWTADVAEEGEWGEDEGRDSEEDTDWLIASIANV